MRNATEFLHDRAEGALSIVAPEDVVEIGHFRIPTDHGAVRCARRTVFTHYEKLTSEPALAPTPGKGPASRAHLVLGLGVVINVVGHNYI